MKVRHEFELSATCPVDGAADSYRCRVTVSRVVMCEDILAAVDAAKAEGPAYQEVLTQRLADRLQGKVRTAGTHVGGKVATVVVCRAAGGA